MPIARNWRINLVLAVKSTGDAKLSATGRMAATWVPQISCWEGCGLYNNGCYAEMGNCGIHTHRLNKRAASWKMAKSKMRTLLARMEAWLIDRLPADVKLRGRIVGDCATVKAANIVGAAMVRYEKRSAKLGFYQLAYGYTHSCLIVPYSAWKGARIMASVDHVRDIVKAKAMGYLGIALVVPPHPSNKVYEWEGVNVFPCPAQFYRIDGKVVAGSQRGKRDGERVITCEKCRVCQDNDRLHELGYVVGFEPDGNSGKRLLRMMSS